MCVRLGRLEEEIRRLEEAGIDGFHFDMMDGHFVPNLGLGFGLLRATTMATKLPVVVHAMIETPERFAEAIADAGVDGLCFHLEATRYPERMMEMTRRLGIRVGIAINPVTSPQALRAVPVPDEVLVMAVEPGFAGSPWIPSTPQQVRSVRTAVSEIPIVVDGHVDETTGALLRRAGATDFVCGSSALFFEGSQYERSLRELRKKLDAVAPVDEFGTAEASRSGLGNE
jgi:ribulose-phosphate 3-epimerase